jgi:catechol 2,3-dioxygenase-like lactoylglutathione lyase family enzyme
MGEVNLKPTFHSVVLLVEDIERSKRFYGAVLGQKVVMDFGRNVGFEGGLAIWERDYALNLIFQGKAQGVKAGGNNLEVYFESGDVEALYKRLTGEGVKVIHSIVEQPWGQRVFRVNGECCSKIRQEWLKLGRNRQEIFDAYGIHKNGSSKTINLAASLGCTGLTAAFQYGS